MICKYCKAEIPEGKMYCPSCGKPVQVVPDYNMLDDDLLSSMIVKKEETEKQEPDSGKKQSVPGSRKKKALFLTILCLVCAVIIGFVLYSRTSGFLLNRAKHEIAEGNYNQAETTLRSVLKQDSRNKEALYELGYVCYQNKDSKNAIRYLKEAVSEDPDSVRTFRLLLKIYQEEKDYDSIEALYKEAGNDKVRAVFPERLTSGITFSREGGSFSEDQTITLSTESSLPIYYTTDGTKPTKGTALLYRDPVKVTDGKTTIRACLIDNDGKAGKIYTETYEVSYDAPSDPVIDPDGGTFSSPADISITADPDCRIYYTWDGSQPTESSTLYTGPIPVMEGNNVLSAIAVNSHDMTSAVVNANFIYLP